MEYGIVLGRERFWNRCDQLTLLRIHQPYQPTTAEAERRRSIAGLVSREGCYHESGIGLGAVSAGDRLDLAL